MKEMKRILLFITTLSLFILTTGCPTDSEETKNNQIQKKFSLLIVMEDRSGSTNDLRKITPEKYKKLFNAFIEKNCGQIAVRVIGNPAPEDNNFYLVDLDCPKPLKKIPKGITIDKRAHLVSLNKKIAKRNSELEQKNKEKVEKFIRDTIIPHIINYKPYKGRDVTDIHGAFEKLETKLEEAGYENFDNIDVLIVSDGVHDASHIKQPLQLKMDKGHLYVVGWKDLSVFKGIKPKRFESVDGFISYYKHKKD